jgi:hypothetical protein
MLTELAANRANMNTAANPACLWLFPADAPASRSPPARWSSRSARTASRATQTRTAAFRQLVLQAPAPVVARPWLQPRNRHLPRRRRRPNLAPLPGQPRRELSAAQRRPASTLAPNPDAAHPERQTAKTLRTRQLT